MKVCKFDLKFRDDDKIHDEYGFELKLFETGDQVTNDIDVDYAKKNLGCSGNCQDLVGGFTELLICSDPSCVTSMADTDPLIVRAGDNITAVVIITVDDLATTNTLVIESLILARKDGEEIAIYYTGIQGLGQVKLLMKLPFPCEGCKMTINVRR